jgi:hypothetical protein
LPSILADGRRIERFGLNADAIVDCKPDPLIRAKVALRCLNGNMTQQHLNLLQFSSRCLTELRATAPHMPHAACAPLCRIPDYAESKPQAPEFCGHSWIAGVSASALSAHLTLEKLIVGSASKARRRSRSLEIDDCSHALKRRRVRFGIGIMPHGEGPKRRTCATQIA